MMLSLYEYVCEIQVLCRTDEQNARMKIMRKESFARLIVRTRAVERLADGGEHLLVSVVYGAPRAYAEI